MSILNQTQKSSARQKKQKKVVIDESKNSSSEKVGKTVPSKTSKGVLKNRKLPQETDKPKTTADKTVTAKPKTMEDKTATDKPKTTDDKTVTENEDQVFLTGFEEEDENDSSDDDEHEQFTQTSEFQSSALPGVKTKPSSNNKPNQKSSEETGVVYLGRIPHGFHEEEMKSYFGQFGDVVRLRMSRSRRTGKSKHYGFIEFKHREVAQIVAETLHNYLLCGNMLQCKLLNKEDLHPRLWIGAGKKFRKDWKHRLLKEKHNKPKTPEQQTAISNRLIQREALKRKRLAELGIDYDFPGYCNAPQPVKTIHKNKKTKKTKSAMVESSAAALPKVKNSSASNGQRKRQSM
ncbi:hypothetical protein O181_049383 [Austropuccinia psidii MF-1]|uniref:RRM domain-containing protein n=1 Tax=Austropuccinia psidii MF-1 TaxID=1389203 RepID=A0A9Q3DZS1_9BASI|nr:hypothetical protein [Austropuccinia psidii MF-1]